jgi:hypothetical protein
MTPGIMPEPRLVPGWPASSRAAWQWVGEDLPGYGGTDHGLPFGSPLRRAPLPLECAASPPPFWAALAGKPTKGRTATSSGAVRVPECAPRPHAPTGGTQDSGACGAFSLEPRVRLGKPRVLALSFFAQAGEGGRLSVATVFGFDLVLRAA